MVEFAWHLFPEQGKTRPVVVISEDEINQILSIVNVLPITTMKADRKIYPNEVFLPSSLSGLPKDSIVLCYQIRTLDKKRLIKKIGKIEDMELQEEINESICFQLGIS